MVDNATTPASDVLAEAESHLRQSPAPIVMGDEARAIAAELDRLRAEVKRLDATRDPFAKMDARIAEVERLGGQGEETVPAVETSRDLFVEMIQRSRESDAPTPPQAPDDGEVMTALEAVLRQFGTHRVGNVRDQLIAAARADQRATVERAVAYERAIADDRSREATRLAAEVEGLERFRRNVARALATGEMDRAGLRLVEASIVETVGHLKSELGRARSTAALRIADLEAQLATSNEKANLYHRYLHAIAEATGDTREGGPCFYELPDIVKQLAATLADEKTLTEAELYAATGDRSLIDVAKVVALAQLAKCRRGG
jgi:hypothetical protein